MTAQALQKVGRTQVTDGTSRPPDEAKDPDMVFEVVWTGTHWDCKADGYGMLRSSGEKGEYGNGSIFVKRLTDVELVERTMPTAYNGPPHCSTCGAAKNVCTWTENEEGLHETTCGNAFQFYVDGPTENGFSFCPYCGREMKDQPYVYETDEDEERERERAVDNAVAREVDDERM